MGFILRQRKVKPQEIKVAKDEGQKMSSKEGGKKQDQQGRNMKKDITNNKIQNTRLAIWIKE